MPEDFCEYSILRIYLLLFFRKDCFLCLICELLVPSTGFHYQGDQGDWGNPPISKFFYKSTLTKNLSLPQKCTLHCLWSPLSPISESPLPTLFVMSIMSKQYFHQWGRLPPSPQQGKPCRVVKGGQPMWGIKP